MGARGKTRRYGDRIAVRFSLGATSKLHILAAMDSITVPELIRRMVDDGLAGRLSPTHQVNPTVERKANGARKG